jgi:hypothetical protein
MVRTTNDQLNWTEVDQDTYNHGIVYSDLMMTGITIFIPDSVTGVRL